LEALKDLVGVSNPGLVTKEDLSRLELRLEELNELLDEIEERVLPLVGQGTVHGTGGPEDDGF
jgi:hypothetical protein